MAVLGLRHSSGTSTRSYEDYQIGPADGLYFAHPQARYFAVGRLGRDQIAAYAERKGVSVATVERWLSNHLAYGPE